MDGVERSVNLSKKEQKHLDSEKAGIESRLMELSAQVVVLQQEKENFRM